MLDPQLKSLLDDLRGRIRRYVVWDSLLAILAIVLSAFWVGWLVDYGPVLLGGSEMPRSARTLLLFAVGLIVLLVAARMLFARLGRPLPDDSLALLVERHHPDLQGRLVTAVQLNQPDRRHDSHSPDLLKRVHQEASDSVDRVDPSRVFRREPLIRKAMIGAPLLLLALGFAAYSPEAFARAAKRLTLLSDERWPRRARLEMVGVDLPVITASATQDAEVERIEFDDRAMRLPIGSTATLRIQADAETAEVPSVCTVYYRTDSGTRGQSNMRRVGRQRDGYQAFVLDGPPMSNLAESFTFSIQGLDDRLTDYRVEAVPPPTITSMNVQVAYPEYLRDPTAAAAAYDLETEYQAGLRIAEGSDVTLEASSSLPLGDVDAVIEADGQEFPVDDLVYSADRRSVRLTLDDLASPTAVRLVPSGGPGITAQAPFRYFLGAVLDEPPTVSLSLSGIQSAVTPIAMLPVTGRAEDDYGVTSLQTFLATAGNPSDTDESDTNAAETVETDADEPDGDDAESKPENQANEAAAAYSVQLRTDRDGQAETVIDLRELTNNGTIEPLRPGDAISVYAEARDGYDLQGKHQTTSEIFRLEVVTPAELLALLERRELGLRTRLEQTVTETQGLRDQLARFRVDGFVIPSGGGEQSTSLQDAEANAEDPERMRQLQVIRLRVQQAGLQASKTAEELNGIAESLDDLLQEMVNNRIDSRDRQERLGSGVRDPIRTIVEVSMTRLKDQIDAIEQSVEEPETAVKQTETAIQTVDQVLLELSAVLEKMLDLESYNEILDLVRGLIDDQEKLREDTQEERKRRVKRLFD